MKLTKMFVAAALLALTSASAAQAGDKILATAPATATGAQVMFCDITNIDLNATKDVTSEIMDINGNTVSGPTVQTIPAGGGVFFGGITAPAAWCKWTVSGSTKKLRGMAIYDDGIGYTMSLPAN